MTKNDRNVQILPPPNPEQKSWDFQEHLTIRSLLNGKICCLFHFIALCPVKEEFKYKVISRKRSYLKTATHIEPEEVFLIKTPRSRSIQ